MGKTSNFKANFSEILGDKYKMTQEGIDGYWDNKAAEEKYNDKKNLAISVGVGEAIGTATFAIWDIAAGADCLVPVAIFGGVALLTTTIALVKSNPYTKEEYEEIDEEYKEEKAKAEKRTKKAKRKIKKVERK